MVTESSCPAPRAAAVAAFSCRRFMGLLFKHFCSRACRDRAGARANGSTEQEGELFPLEIQLHAEWSHHRTCRRSCLTCEPLLQPMPSLFSASHIAGIQLAMLS